MTFVSIGDVFCSASFKIRQQSAENVSVMYIFE